MLQGKHALTKRKRKALPALGAAGLSLTLASAASAAAIGGQTADALTRNASAPEISLSEEEIADVSLATFYVFDNEGAGTSQRGVRLAQGGCGCGGCGGCGSCSSSDNTQVSPTWSNVGTLSIRPARGAVRTPRRTSGHRSP